MTAEPLPDNPMANSAIEDRAEGGLASPGAVPPPADRDARRAALDTLRAGERPSGPLDLSGLRLVEEDLSGLDLSGARLVGCDLSRAQMVGTTLFGADISRATLYGACLDEAELTGAKLVEANLDGASLVRAGMGQCDLSRASLVEADLSGSTLIGATLAGAVLRMARLVGVRARTADWTQADLTRATFDGADLDEGNVRGARFDNADLGRARLRHLVGYDRAIWLGAHVHEVDFSGAFLCRKFILDQNYLEEFRRRGFGSRVLYRAWWVTSDCGRSVLRWSACTGFLVLGFAWLYTLVNVDWGKYPSQLSPLYYSVVTMTTLGYGDIVPASNAAKWIAMAQVVTGYVMLGGLLSIFSNKMATRAD